MKVLNWGLGVQSTALAVMAIRGDFGIDRPDVIISADTGWERRASYEIRDFYSAYFEGFDIDVKILPAGDIKKDGVLEHIHMPFWTSSGGPIWRQCTRHFKLTPLKRASRVLAGYHPTEPPHPPKGAIENWIGFSWDELERMSDSRVNFAINRYPLVEKRLTRNDCTDYLKSLNLPVPIKSSCSGCPYLDAAELLAMKTNSPAEFDEVCEFDENIRRLKPLKDTGVKDDLLYVYKKCVPLAEAELEKDVLKLRPGKQLALFCSDICHT